MKTKIDPTVALIESALEQNLPPVSAPPREVHRAMRYAVLNGGKRFRPRLVLAACEAVGGDPRQALLPACAVEFIHAYSLVHDDLPALDNDDLRRGKPTCHRKFGEAVAILVGDSLLTRAFELLSKVRPASKALLLIRELAEASGTRGMIGGQVADVLLSQNGRGAALNLSTLDFISRRKTGCLIEASAVMGARMGTNSPLSLQRIRRLGRALGLAFQVVDDTIDGDGFLHFMNRDQARRKARVLIRSAQREAQSFEKKGERLLELSDFLLQRATPDFR